MNLDTNIDLWHTVQRMVYPRRWPSSHPPFAVERCSPKVKPASWLYHQLNRDAYLRALLLP